MPAGILVGPVQINKKLLRRYMKKKERTVGGCKF